jgi:DNA-binding transcriptional LysR family regulator
MIELRLWCAFVVLAEELHFRRAATRLAITQPALTKRIRELEARLGVALFARAAGRVTLTPAGEAALADAGRW